MCESNHLFPEVLAAHQRRLLSYIQSLLGAADSSWDVLQETNRVLLEKRFRAEPGQPITERWLRVKSGVAEITFSSGATVTTRFRITDNERIRFASWRLLNNTS